MLALSQREVFDAQRGMFRQVNRAMLQRPVVPRHPVSLLIDRAAKLYGVGRAEIVRTSRRGGVGILAMRWICYRVVIDRRATAADAARRLGLSDHSTVLYHAHAHSVTCGLPAPCCHRRQLVGRLSYVGPEPQEALV